MYLLYKLMISKVNFEGPCVSQIAYSVICQVNVISLYPSWGVQYSLETEYRLTRIPFNCAILLEPIGWLAIKSAYYILLHFEKK